MRYPAAQLAVIGDNPAEMAIMKTKPATPLPAIAKKQRAKTHLAIPTSNAALNQQNRRVLAQHYRAKYGVK